MDFMDLKAIVKPNIIDKYDHSLVLNANSPHSNLDLSSFEKVYYLPYQPTSENLVIDFANCINVKLPDGVDLIKVVLSETATSYELGADLRLFNNRIGIDFTYYNQKTTDQILSLPISLSTGYTHAFINAGEIQNKGVELLISATIIDRSGFIWNASFNYAKNKNERLFKDKKRPKNTI